MAHYACLDENDEVTKVIVIDNVEEYTLGIAGIEQRLAAIYGYGIWLKTSYNKKVRGNYAGIGFSYHSDADTFVRPIPHSGWVLNKDKTDWEAPIDMPTAELADDELYIWDDSLEDWIVHKRRTPE